MIKKLTLTLVAFLAVVIGFLTIAPSEMSFDDAGYNSKNVLEHLQVIADKPHSVTDYEAHEEVRQYILNVSKGFVGEENVRERNYLTPSNKNPTDGIEYVGADLVETNEIDCEYDIRNVLACLNGKSETGVLLVAHYDSRGNIKRYGELAKSYGAGDDGYGVATLLELMRYFSERKDALENSVYFLFTDSEEPNMYGSLLESKNTELMNKVNLVINVEARGMNGAVYMFETSLKNNKVIKLFRKAESPVTYSVAPAVYSVMTNYTDFTNFLAAGKNGLNFSTLNDINDYHVPSDCYANVNTATVQHYGEQLLPIVEEYVSDAVYSDMNYFDGTHDAVFFNFLPEVFVSYSSVTAVVLAVCVLLALTALIVVGALKKQFDFKSWGKYIGFVLIGLAIAVAVGMVVSLVTARLNGYPWSLVNVRSACSDWILVLTRGRDFCSLAFSRQAPAAFRRVENVQFRRRDCSGNPQPDCGNSAFRSVLFVPYTGACGRNLSCGGAVCEKRLGKENGRLPFSVLHSLYLRTAHFFAAIRFDRRRSCGAYRVGVFPFQRAAPHALRRNQGGQRTGKARRSGNRVRTITEIYRKSFSCHL